MRAEPAQIPSPVELYVRRERDLADPGLWRRSRERSSERRRRAAAAGLRRRTLLSDAILDLDGPPLVRGRGRGAADRDLSSHELWELSGAVAHAKRRAVRRPALAQARTAGASLLVAAVAASAAPTALPQSRNARAGGTTQVDSRLLRVGSRGPAVASLQRALGIPADGVFGPQTRRAVRAFQAEHGLTVDGIAGPQTRAALAGATTSGGFKSFKAPWVADVQRALGLPADGVFGPQTRAAVIAFQKRKGLAPDGVVGPKTLAALGLSGVSAAGGSGGTATAAAPSSAAVTALRVALAQVGKPYAWGGTGPGSFDCSGLVSYSFRQAGVSLPRTSYAMYGAGRSVSRGTVRAGDLVFFATNGPGASHVGIATSSSSFVSATSRGVRVQPIGGSYWGAAYVGARRVGG